MNREKIKEWLKESDGYRIMAPEFFNDMGLEYKIQTFSSDPDLGKHSATRNDGKPGDVEGVAEFDVIEDLCDKLGVSPHTMYHGRGTHFRALKARVLEALDK